MRDLPSDFLASTQDLRLTPEEKDMSRTQLHMAMQVLSAGEEAQLRLTDEEHKDCRTFLRQYMDHNPIPRWSLRHAFKHFYFFSDTPLSLRIPAFATAFVLLTGGTLAAAAQGALPGDFLYSFKVSVTEPIMGVFQPDSAKWNEELLSRRLQEAELSARNNSSNQQQADAALAQQTSLFLGAVDAKLAGDANHELRHTAVQQFEAITTQVSGRKIPDVSKRAILRTLMAEKNRIEQASLADEASSSSSSLGITAAAALHVHSASGSSVSSAQEESSESSSSSQRRVRLHTPF